MTQPSGVRILFIGDVVGPGAVEWLAGRLPALRAGNEVDFVIADAENCAADGNSMTLAGVERLLEAGVDVVTGGNHAFEGPEFEAVLAHERVLRPLNVANGVPGRGTLDVRAGAEQVRVVVVADSLALETAPAFAAMAAEPYASLMGLGPGPTTIVEMHALSVAEKQALAYALDGEVAAVLGTHTHEPTIDLHLLPGGTALVTDVGMTGPRGGIQGMDPRAMVERLKGLEGPARATPHPAAGDMVLGAILLEIEDGRTRRLRRLT